MNLDTSLRMQAWPVLNRVSLVGPKCLSPCALPLLSPWLQADRGGQALGETGVCS